MKIAALAILVALCGCAGQPAPACTCPPIYDWSPDEQTAIAADLDALPTDSALNGPMTEWDRLRAWAKACKS